MAGAGAGADAEVEYRQIYSERQDLALTTPFFPRQNRKEKQRPAETLPSHTRMGNIMTIT